MNGMLGLHCYTSTVRRRLDESASASSSSGMDQLEVATTISDSWWNPLRSRALTHTARV